LCPKFLTKEEIAEKIKEFLTEHNYNFSENVKVQKRLKAIDYAITTADSKIAIMLFIWNRSLPYDKIYYLEEYLNKYGIDKVILICKQISPRAKEIIQKERINIEIIFESDFRTMKSNPLIGKL